MDVIILNGASSSGKSSIARQLQSLLADNYLHIGIDTFIGMMPERCNKLAEADIASDGFYWKTENTAEGPLQRIQSGDYGKQVNQAYHSTVKHLVDSGLKVIVDDVMDGKTEQRAWFDDLGESHCLFIGVFCEENELSRRESIRGDRIKGSAIEQARRVHTGVNYDFTVSTDKLSAVDCAKQIVSYVSNL